jgi:ABC-2 type transport system permease protein
MAIAQQTPPSELKPRAAPSRSGRWSGYTHLLMARMKELKREPEVIFWVFVFPLLLALGLGIAFRNKPADVTSIAIVSGPGARDALALLERAPQHGSIRTVILDQAQALRDFRLGKYDLVVEAEAGGKIQYRYDPARPESVLSRIEVDDALQDAAGRKDPVSTSAVASTEPGSRYIDFLIPGLLGMNLMNAAMWGIGFALVDMRQRKLLKRFVGTPMRRSDFLLALTSSRLVLMLIGAIGAIAFGGVGLLTASRAQKIESVSGLINLVMMPMWIFSGVFFSYARFPAITQPFIKALPLTALNDALRDTILQGAPLASQSGRLLILALWGGISFVLALRLFRWT